MEGITCSVKSCEKPLDQSYWDLQYQSETTGWDLGTISPPIKAYVDQLKDTTISVLIPGCGNTYEAEYLLEKGFTNITVIDIAPTLVEKLKEKFKNTTAIHIIQGDFFEHKGSYDLILEQTFFCALPPQMRQKYVWKMHQLLSKNGKKAGLLFNRSFEVSPPFGGSKTEYEQLFSEAFHFKILETSYNSVTPRAQSELFFVFKKKAEVIVQCFALSGITCSNCTKTVLQKIGEITGVINTQINSTFSNLIVMSTNEISLEQLKEVLAYEPEYSIALVD
ncbi:methyltransferase domain-containing protein [Flavobacterium polysaccharolyticum]|uniref:Methyltransferase domain-containing protein n=1 Tax=Flavobacterium polysaccharolyticum TaxID=3133148 RepID=A0ABU9NT94_9FLAO